LVFNVTLISLFDSKNNLKLTIINFSEHNLFFKE
jgi:hypothetical protein